MSNPITAGCQILPGDSLYTCDIDPGGSLGGIAGTLNWSSGFPAPLPALGLGQPGLGYMPSGYPLGCTASSGYPGHTSGNSGVPTGFGGDRICEIAFNNPNAGSGSAGYTVYASPSAPRGSRYLVGLTSNYGSCFAEEDFYVRIRPLACSIDTFTKSYLGGNRWTLSWSVSNGTNVQITNIGSVPATGSATVGPGTYTLTATGCSSSTEVLVAEPTCSLNASPSSGSAPLSGSLSWSTTNASSCTASGGWSGAKNPSGGSETYGPLSGNTTYTLTCSNVTGSQSCSAPVNVSSPVARYSCSGSSCVSNPLGPFTTSNCDNTCSGGASCSGTITASPNPMPACSGNTVTLTVSNATCNFYIRVVPPSGPSQVMTSMSEPPGSRTYTTGPWASDGMRFELVNAATNQVIHSVTVTGTNCGGGGGNRYSCSGSSCVLNSSGPYTTSDCSGACTVVTPKYRCSGSSCIRDDISGSYTTSNCNSVCTAPTRYSCSGSACVVDQFGPYTTSNCNSACTVVTPKYRCSGSSCIRDDVFGSYTTSNCNSACISFPICGNGVLEAGEQCDTGAFRGACPAACSFSCTINTCSSPSNLTITSFSLTDSAGTPKSSFAPGERIYPSVTILNNGSSPTTPSTGFFYLSVYSNAPGQVAAGTGSDVNVWVKEPGSIAPGQAKTYSVTTNSAYWTNDGSNQGFWTRASAGSFTARAFVDSYNYVTETNEFDNQAVFGYSVSSVPPPAPAVDIKANGSDGPLTIPFNTGATLSWVSSNASSCTAAGGWSGAKPTSGSEPTGNLTSNRIYTVTCTGPGGSASDSVTVNVSGPPAPTVDLKVNGSDGPVGINRGSSGTLSWTAMNASSCTASGAWSGAKSSSGGSESTGALSTVGTFTYTLSCTGPGGSATDSVTVNVNATCTPRPFVGGSVSPASVQAGSAYTVVCDYGAVTNAINPVVGSGSCGFVGFSGTQARFSCTAGATPGTFSNSCVLSTIAPDFYCASSNPIGSLTVTPVVVPRPTISLNPTGFSFTARVGDPAPAGQTLTIGNTGNAVLNFSATTNRNWCRINGVNSSGSVTGTLAPGGTVAVTVSVDAPSNVGTFDCTVTVSDPNATNNPQTAAVLYTVNDQPGCSGSVCDPGCPSGNCGGGGGWAVTASSATCGQINLSWQPGSGATRYNIYRETTPGSPKSPPLAANVSGTSYADAAVTVGTTYYYWVQTSGGTGNFVPADTNASGGIRPVACITPPSDPGSVHTYNSSNDPLRPGAAAARCAQVRVIWTDRSADEDGFRIYSDGNLIGTVGPNTGSFTYQVPDIAPHRYAVSAFKNPNVESAQVQGDNNPVSAVPCDANLGSSDKDITGHKSASFPTGDCNGFQAPPSSAKFAAGDIVKFTINLCNSSTDEDAASLSVLDTLTNLGMPQGGWNARYQNTAGAWQNIAPTFDAAAKTLRFDFPAAFRVPKAPAAGSNTVRKLYFEAKLTAPTQTATYSRFQNTAVISYQKNVAGEIGTVPVATALIPFSTGTGVPDRIEISP